MDGRWDDKRGGKRKGKERSRKGHRRGEEKREVAVWGRGRGGEENKSFILAFVFFFSYTF